MATDKTWTGATNANWGVNGNWTGNAPSAGDNAVFNSTFTNQPNVNGSQTAGGIWMTGSVGQNVTISGNTLTLQGNTINGTAGLGVLIDNTNAYTLTISAPVKVGNSETWTNNSGNLFTVGTGGVDTNGKALTINGSGNTTISGVVSNSGSMTKSGTGTLTLSGANTFSGSTIVNGGTLTLSAGSGSALGSTSGVTVNSGGTLLLGTDDQINNNATMTLADGTFSKGNYHEGSASSVGIGALTLSASGSHINFGTGTVGTLTFASLSAGLFTLTIENWTGTANTVGNASTDRLIFDSDQVLNLASFNFTGYVGAVEFALGGGFYEVVPLGVPEPSTWVVGILGFGVIAFAEGRRRLRLRGHGESPVPIASRRGFQPRSLH